jgi:diamine N-acetyltransferase
MSISKGLFAEKCYSVSSITLRILEKSDVDLVSEILSSMEPWQTLGYTKSCLQAYLCSLDPSLRRYVLWKAEKIIGVVGVRFPWLRGPYLELLAVFPSAQGGGIGRQIIRWMEFECQATSKNIWTVTSEFNENARKFYRKTSFVEVATLPDLVTNGFNEILLRKAINPQ